MIKNESLPLTSIVERFRRKHLAHLHHIRMMQRLPLIHHLHTVRRLHFRADQPSYAVLDAGGVFRRPIRHRRWQHWQAGWHFQAVQRMVALLQIVGQSGGAVGVQHVGQLIAMHQFVAQLVGYEERGRQLRGRFHVDNAGRRTGIHVDWNANGAVSLCVPAE